MDILDFDDTIYDGDSFIDILKYSFVRHPFIFIKSIIKTIPLFRKYKNKEIKFEKVKEALLSFLFQINDLEKYIDKFVDKKIHKIKKWYLDKDKDNDIIISASYELWLKPFCYRLGVDKVIGTKTDKKGKIIGLNCKREEKIKRLKIEYPDIIVNNAYSDSKSDTPMFEVAKNGYVVEGNNLNKYTKKYNFKRTR